MKIKDKITQSLASITVELQEISPDFYVIGASAMILSGIEVGETADIDILTTEMNSCKLQHLLKTYMECHICPIRALLMDFYLTMKTLHVQYIGCPGK